MFPKVPQSSLGILRVPQLPPLEHPPLGTLQSFQPKTPYLQPGAVAKTARWGRFEGRPEVVIKRCKPLWFGGSSEEIGVLEILLKRNNEYSPSEVYVCCIGGRLGTIS